MHQTTCEQQPLIHILANKPVDNEVQQATVLPNTVFEAVVWIPCDKQLKQVLANGEEKEFLNVGVVLILQDGFMN